jgi:hypothetical protein
MGPVVSVIFLPPGQHVAHFGEVGEDGLVQQFVPQPGIEAFDESILLRLARCDVMSFDAVGFCPS